MHEFHLLVLPVAAFLALSTATLAEAKRGAGVCATLLRAPVPRHLGGHTLAVYMLQEPLARVFHWTYYDERRDALQMLGFLATLWFIAWAYEQHVEPWLLDRLAAAWRWADRIRPR